MYIAQVVLNVSITHMAGTQYVFQEFLSFWRKSLNNGDGEMLRVNQYWNYDGTYRVHRCVSTTCVIKWKLVRASGCLVIIVERLDGGVCAPTKSDVNTEKEEDTLCKDAV